MASEHYDWTVPAPLRALLWWPPVAFVLVLIDPTAAAQTIALVGAALAVLGVVGAAVGRAIARRLAHHAAGTGEHDTEPALVMAAAQDAVAPLAVQQRAA
jgi:uncharacterized membrane protein YsdA (DUF1294 family)